MFTTTTVTTTHCDTCTSTTAAYITSHGTKSPLHQVTPFQPVLQFKASNGRSTFPLTVMSQPILTST